MNVTAHIHTVIAEETVREKKSKGQVTRVANIFVLVLTNMIKQEQEFFLLIFFMSQSDSQRAQ